MQDQALSNGIGITVKQVLQCKKMSPAPIVLNYSLLPQNNLAVISHRSESGNISLAVYTLVLAVQYFKIWLKAQAWFRYMYQYRDKIFLLKFRACQLFVCVCYSLIIFALCSTLVGVESLPAASSFPQCGDFNTTERWFVVAPTTVITMSLLQFKILSIL